MIKNEVYIFIMITFNEWSSWNNTEVVRMNIPLLIRVFEYMREKCKSDVELHKVVEKLIIASRGNKTLSMEDYRKICS